MWEHCQLDSAPTWLVKRAADVLAPVIAHMCNTSFAQSRMPQGISSQMVCKATFNSSVVLCFGWSLWYFSSMVPQMWQSNGFKSGELEGQSSLLNMNPFAFNRCLTLAHWERWGGVVLVEIACLSLSNKFQPNLVIKCIFDCLTVL